MEGLRGHILTAAGAGGRSEFLGEIRNWGNRERKVWARNKHEFPTQLLKGTGVHWMSSGGKNKQGSNIPFTDLREGKMETKKQQLGEWKRTQGRSDDQELAGN